MPGYGVCVSILSRTATNKINSTIFKFLSRRQCIEEVTIVLRHIKFTDTEIIHAQTDVQNKMLEVALRESAISLKGILSKMYFTSAQKYSFV